MNPYDKIWIYHEAVKLFDRYYSNPQIVNFFAENLYLENHEEDLKDVRRMVDFAMNNTINKIYMLK